MWPFVTGLFHNIMFPGFIWAVADVSESHPFYGQVIFHCIEPRLCLLFNSRWAFRWFPLLIIMSNAALIICVQVFVWTCFISLGYLPRSGIARLYDNSMRNCQTIVQSGCIILFIISTALYLVSHILHVMRLLIWKELFFKLDFLDSVDTERYFLSTL